MKWVYYKLNTDSKDLKVRQLLSLLPMWLNEEAPIKLLKEKIINEKNVDMCNFQYDYSLFRQQGKRNLIDN